jgi:hypothetical protein
MREKSEKIDQRLDRNHRNYDYSRIGNIRETTENKTKTFKPKQPINKKKEQGERQHKKEPITETQNKNSQPERDRLPVRVRATVHPSLP